MAEGGKTEEFGDEQLEELFSAFDELSASESLKSGTLAAIAGLSAAAGAGAAAGAAGVPTAEAASGPTASAPTAEEAAVQAGGTPKVTATRGKRPRIKGRGIRATAVAASLALVVTGGVAYATPTSIVTVAQGDSAIELGVNYFGTSVSASSDDEVGRVAVESSNLVHVPYGDALSRAANALDAAGASGSLELFVESADEGQRARLAGQNQVFLADREEEGPLPDSEPPAEPGTAGERDGAPGEPGAPGAGEADGALPDEAQPDGAQPDGASGGVSAGSGQSGGSAAYGWSSAQDNPSVWASYEPTRASSSGGVRQPSGDEGSEEPVEAIAWAVVKEPKSQPDPGGIDGGENLAQRVPEVNEADEFNRLELPAGYFSYIDPSYSEDWSWSEDSEWWIGPTYPGWTWGDKTSERPCDPTDSQDREDQGNPTL